MRFLTNDEVINLTPQAWRLWNPSKYKGGLWWKFEEFIDASGILERPQVKHKLSEKHLFKIQYIPFARIILKPKGTHASVLSLKKPSRRESLTKQKEISCVAVACSKSGNKFLALDTLDNLYFFDLDESKFWKILNLPGIQLMSFCHLSTKEIVLGKSNSIIDKLSIDPEIMIGHFTQHVFPIKDIVFFSDEICLSYSQFEAWIWNCFTFEVVHSLTFQNSSIACLLTILPNSCNLFLTALSDRTLHLWKRDMTNKEAPRQVASYTCNDFMMDCTINSVAFNSKCSSMALAGKQKGISIVNIEEEYWRLNRILYLPQTANEVKQMKFIELPEMLFGVRNWKKKECLAVFTMPFQEFLIYDLETRHYDDEKRPICFLIDVESEPRSFHLMSSGSLALFQVSGGFVDVYTTFWWLNEKFCPWLHYSRQIAERAVQSGLERPLLLPSSHLDSPRDNYRYVLWRLGTLPPSERQAYWRLALILPGNLSAFRTYVLSYLHPAVLNLSQQYPTLPKENLFSLIRLYSAFCFISPIFFLVNDFPEVLLRFCKVFTWSLMGVFESVLSIFNNYCSDWYIDYPNPPMNLTNIISKILTEKDPLLSAHFENHKINIANISWSLMSNLFLKALNFNEWLLLWDHILFSDKYYIIMATASLILNSRCTFMRHQCLENVEDFANEISNSEFNIWSVILVAYDLLDIYKPEESTQGVYQPLQKGNFDHFFKMKYDKELILSAVQNKLNRQIMMDIEKYKTIDTHKLLDPREHHKTSRTLFTKEDSSQRRFISRHSIAEFKRDSEEKEEGMQSKISGEFQREREYKFSHLQKLLEKQQLHWISNQRARVSDCGRLELFKTKWPEEYKLCEATLKIERQVPSRKSKKMSQYQKIVFKKASLEVNQSNAFPNRNILKNKNSQREKGARKEAPSKQTNAKSGQQGSTKKRPSGAKKRGKSMGDKLSTMSVEEAKAEEQQPEGVEDEYLSEWNNLKVDAKTLTIGLRTVAQDLEEVRQGIRKQTELPTKPRTVPATQLQHDWRKERREQFLVMLDELNDKTSSPQKK